MFCWTGSTPGIKSSICEDYPRGSHVFFICDSSKMVESVVVIRFNSELFEALIRIAIIVKICCPEHILNSISIHWHCLISAGEDVPATHILIWRAIGIDIVACCFIEGVIIFDRLSECWEEDVVRGESGDWVKGNAWGVSWPCGYVFEEGSGIGVVDHCHVGVCDIDVIN